MATIELNNITKGFGTATSSELVLDHVNFVSNAGEVTIITGPSGSGKSTLLTIMGALRNPDAGEVWLSGTQVNQLSQRDQDHFRLEKIGFILQAHTLVPFLTVHDQFRLVDQVKPTGNLTPAHQQELLETLDIADLKTHYPAELSGGQSQRVAIARGLYTQPELILADEPTASLDEARVTKVCELLAAAAREQGKTVVIVTHDDRMYPYADHLYELLDGQLRQRR
ncbi:ABC transporter ATP-binding protein [Fructilactobacillus myrtifloralis]|uniref:ABC transporter ATP-binding protein n=1 Tax=Fructilactobacillus myrtifloralis TaxID=2940301 RepID=A0ABY5BNK0_9LACO|nr:ABC transporter ATP-binding protein [Fructilactobacillus myrtifloralis]USS84820.1 ABC transporter ATP-binding protein [Fructilactobacillus myrtifloralis]